MKKPRSRAQKLEREYAIRAWVSWLKKYGARKYLESFLHNVEGARGTCRHCHQEIFVDVLIGGGVPDWSTKDGDFGCDRSPETCSEGTGGHMPIKR